MNPDLSIVMCCFNGEKYLEESLQSLLNQSKSDFEFIFINDGSTDRTEEIVLRRSKDFKCFKYVHQKNLGLQKSRNIGTLKASPNSTFIMFVDSDDTFDSGFVETLYTQIIKSECVASIHCNIKQFDNNNDNYYGDLVEFKFGLPFFSKRAKINLFDILSGNHRIVEAASIYRKSLIVKFGGWDEKNFPKGNTYGESVPLLINLALEGDVIFLNEVLYYYRIHDNQITNLLQPNLRGIKTSTNLVLKNYFSITEHFLIKGIVLSGCHLINFKSRYKYMLRYKFFSFLLYLPLFFFSYLQFSFFRLFLSEKSRNLLFN